MAITINRVYTGVGDKGTTRLVDGSEVPKDSHRVQAYGCIDELNAAIGMARVFNEERMDQGEKHVYLDQLFRRIQNELFDLGSELATAPGKGWKGMKCVEEADVKALEAVIDECGEELETLKSFILPGGGRIHGSLHVARTVCRRAERDIVTLAREEEVNPNVSVYVNRLSDLLFVLGRWVGKHLGETEYLWERGLKSHEK